MNEHKLVTQNAIIQSTTITSADHGCLSAWLHLEHSGGCQGFGGYALYLPKSYKHHALQSVAGHFIWRCMEIAGVEYWENMPGKTIRVQGTASKIIAIGHIVKDDWFDPEKDFEEARLKKG